MAELDLLKIISKPVTPTSPLTAISKPVATNIQPEANPATPTSNFLGGLFSGTGKFAPETKLGVARNTITGLPKALGETIASILRAPGRAATSIQLTAEGKEQLTPETTAEKVVFGKEPVKSIGKRNREATETLEKFGFGKSSKVLAPLGVIGSTLLDVYPGGAGEKKGAKLAAEEVFDATKYVAEQTAKRNAARIAAGDLSLLGKAKGLLSEIKNKLVDFTAPIEDILSATTKKEGIKLLPSEDIHNQIDRVLRSPTLAGQFAEDKGIVDVIKNVDNIENLDQYLTAKHAIELDTRGIETGRELVKDQELVKAFAPQYEETAKKVANYSNEMMNYAVKSGLISEDLAKTLRERYPDYVPFNRVFNELEAEAGRAAGGGVASINNQTFIRNIEGSTREVESPIQSLLSKTNDLFKQGEKNIAAKLLAGYEKLPGNPFQLKEIPAGSSPSTGMGSISYFDNGEKKTFETTKAVADAAKALNVQQMNILGKIFALPVRVARIGITGINPAFVTANMAKDQVTAFINSSKPLESSIANPFNFMRSLFSAVKHDDLYKEMVRAGGGGTTFDISRDAAEATLESIRAGRNLPSKILYTVKNPGELLRAVENVVSRSEEFTRIQQYNATKQALLKEGLSETEAITGAARAARENTVNFARRGEWGNVLNSAFLYLNAGIQGTRTLVRNLKDKPLQTAAKIAVGSIFPTAVITSWNLSDPKRREAYEDIAEYEKENNLIIVPPDPVKDDTGKWNVIKIPLSQEINNLSSISRKFLETAQGAAEAKFSDIARYIIGTVSPINPTKGSVLSTLTPQAIKPSLEVGINKNVFTGKSIVPDFMTKLPTSQQVQSYTSGTAKKIGNLLKVSPLKVEAFIKETFGGVGSQALNAIDQFLAETGIIPKDEIGGQNVLDAVTARFNKAQGSFGGGSPADKILNKNKVSPQSSSADDILNKYEITPAANTAEDILRKYGL